MMDCGAESEGLVCLLQCAKVPRQMLCSSSMAHGVLGKKASTKYGNLSIASWELLISSAHQECRYGQTFQEAVKPETEQRV